MITNKKKFYGGLVGLGLFFVLLAVMFMPLFDGDNALAYSDELFNKISKDSSYSVPSLQEESQDYVGTSINTSITMDTAEQAQQTALMYQKAGAEAVASEAKVTIKGDLGKIVEACLADAAVMHQNNGPALVEKYGYSERQAMYNWWESFDKIRKNLDKAGLNDEEKFVRNVTEDAIEPAYNFYGIEAKSVSSSMGILVFALVFYVVYTIWYGFSLMYLLEGWGLATKH
ncbi:MAG: hypothetical protein WC749_07585 [Dehalococcoidia bacterium]